MVLVSRLSVIHHTILQYYYQLVFWISAACPRSPKNTFCSTASFCTRKMLACLYKDIVNRKDTNYDHLCYVMPNDVLLWTNSITKYAVSSISGNKWPAQNKFRYYIHVYTMTSYHTEPNKKQKKKQKTSCAEQTVWSRNPWTLHPEHGRSVWHNFYS